MPAIAHSIWAEEFPESHSAYNAYLMNVCNICSVDYFKQNSHMNIVMLHCCCFDGAMKRLRLPGVLFCDRVLTIHLHYGVGDLLCGSE